MDAFVWRHPLWSLAGLILVIGFVMDMLLEVTLVRTGLYIYSQVIPWGSLFPRHNLSVSSDLGIHLCHLRHDSGWCALLPG